VSTVEDRTEDVTQVRELARDFVEREIRPNADTWDREAVFPRGVIDRMGELGFLGMLIPEEWDGLGMSTVAYLAALEEIARGDASVAVAMSVHNSLPTQMILAHGTPEQKDRWLRPMARGELLGVFALSEAEAGSDAASLCSRARKVDGGWVLDGSKAWITNGGFGDVAVCMCRTGPAPGARGIGAFIVPTDAEGWIVGKKEDKMGQRASETVAVTLQDLYVPDEQLLGDPNLGLTYALAGLDGGRLGIAALAIGIGRAALEHSVRYANERVQFGTPVGHFGGMRFKLADMATRVEAASALLLSAAAAKGAGERITAKASMAKLFASEMAMYVTTEAVQVFGGYGYMSEYPVEKLFRDAKVTEIYEGTSEIQRLVISRELYASFAEGLGSGNG